eukprot:TRINITY_DN17266_c0_g1_i1.p1 TRINITY_DN17266_c0_g1~~TRINITY_DN17266_c0_g1_i1.p1  ORF type:complete len:505 (+),score=48.17 TRINITY_DN17266_c0_g1_i1:125-1639(+)
MVSLLYQHLWCILLFCCQCSLLGEAASLEEPRESGISSESDDGRLLVAGAESTPDSEFRAEGRVVVRQQAVSLVRTTTFKGGNGLVCYAAEGSLLCSLLFVHSNGELTSSREVTIENGGTKHLVLSAIDDSHALICYTRGVQQECLCRILLKKVDALEAGSEEVWCMGEQRAASSAMALAALSSARSMLCSIESSALFCAVLSHAAVDASGGGLDAGQPIKIKAVGVEFLHELTVTASSTAYGMVCYVDASGPRHSGRCTYVPAAAASSSSAANSTVKGFSVFLDEDLGAVADMPFAAASLVGLTAVSTSIGASTIACYGDSAEGVAAKCRASTSLSFSARSGPEYVLADGNISAGLAVAGLSDTGAMVCLQGESLGNQTDDAAAAEVTCWLLGVQRRIDFSTSSRDLLMLAATANLTLSSVKKGASLSLSAASEDGAFLCFQQAGSSGCTCQLLHNGLVTTAQAAGAAATASQVSSTVASHGGPWKRLLLVSGIWAALCVYIA